MELNSCILSMFHNGYCQWSDCKFPILSDSAANGSSGSGGSMSDVVKDYDSLLLRCCQHLHEKHSVTDLKTFKDLQHQADTVNSVAKHLKEEETVYRAMLQWILTKPLQQQSQQQPGDQSFANTSSSSSSLSLHQKNSSTSPSSSSTASSSSSSTEKTNHNLPNLLIHNPSISAFSTPTSTCSGGMYGLNVEKTISQSSRSATATSSSSISSSGSPTISIPATTTTATSSSSSINHNNPRSPRKASPLPPLTAMPMPQSIFGLQMKTRNSAAEEEDCVAAHRQHFLNSMITSSTSMITSSSSTTSYSSASVADKLKLPIVGVQIPTIQYCPRYAAAAASAQNSSSSDMEAEDSRSVSSHNSQNSQYSSSTSSSDQRSLPNSPRQTSPTAAPAPPSYSMLTLDDFHLKQQQNQQHQISPATLADEQSSILTVAAAAAQNGVFSSKLSREAFAAAVMPGSAAAAVDPAEAFSIGEIDAGLERDLLTNRDSYANCLIRPEHSYASLIRHAILTSPMKRLTLQEIYNWFSKNFAFFRFEKKLGWKGAIRHALSARECFLKKSDTQNSFYEIDENKDRKWMLRSRSHSLMCGVAKRRTQSNVTAETFEQHQQAAQQANNTQGGPIKKMMKLENEGSGSVETDDLNVPENPVQN